MADNYLEKKMEEHRSPQRPAYRQKLTPRGTKPGELLVKFRPCRAIITDASTPLMNKITGELTAIGFKVAFNHNSSREGALLAQHCGARFSPILPSPEDDDIMITPDAAQFQISITKGKFRININCPDFVNESEAVVNATVWSATQLANFNNSQESMLTNIKIEGLIL
jgi:hypothetical protein